MLSSLELFSNKIKWKGISFSLSEGAIVDLCLPSLTGTLFLALICIHLVPEGLTQTVELTGQKEVCDYNNRLASWHLQVSWKEIKICVHFVAKGIPDVAVPTFSYYYKSVFLCLKCQ